MVLNSPQNDGRKKMGFYIHVAGSHLFAADELAKDFRQQDSHLGPPMSRQRQLHSPFDAESTADEPSLYFFLTEFVFFFAHKNPRNVSA